MKCDYSTEIVHKDVVVIGNGPSGLALSYMLSGNIPYLISNAHPDELLSARLNMVRDQSLAHQELDDLANGLEGRSRNPISLLLDALTHPYADNGLELDSLVEWRKTGIEIDHVVIGKGAPGGSWHEMDPNILTLSLGSWMALPGFPYKIRDGSEKRASAGNVANYYVQYVNKMKLGRYFENGYCVTNVKQLNEYSSDVTGNVIQEYRLSSNICDRKNETLNKWVTKVDEDEHNRTKICVTPETDESALIESIKRNCISNVLNAIYLRTNRKCKRRRDFCLKNESNPNRKFRDILQKSNSIDEEDMYVPMANCKNIKKFATCCVHCSERNRTRSVSFSCDFGNFEYSCDSKSFYEQGSKNSYSLNYLSLNKEVPIALTTCDKKYDLFRLKENCDPCTSSASIYRKSKSKGKWVVETYNTNTGRSVTYICKNLVLANGANDLPNRLAISTYYRKDPGWLMHDVRRLELELDRYVSNNPNSQPDPVLVIGAGLSAADAIIATRCRNIPVLHIFRNKSTNLGKQLPENMYPEYHKVHQMMQDGGSSYSLYEALPESSLIDMNESQRTITVRTKSGDEVKYHVSFAAVLIGARPDLSFLPCNFNLGVNKKIPIDNKTNIIDIDKLTHRVNGFDNLYVMGPLAGDNFVRFIPGGGLAIVSDLYKKNVNYD